MDVSYTRRYQNAGACAWELMYDVFRSSKPFLEAIAASFELTGQMVFALRQLSSDRPSTMGTLAMLLGCDASNVTSVVDKLEKRGLVTRRSDESDRRVKTLVLTEAGESLRRRIEDRMEVPPPAIARLSHADQVALCEIFGRALEGVQASQA